MKNKKALINTLLAFALISPLMISCGGDDGGGGGEEPPKQTKMSKVQFISKLDNTPIGSTDADFTSINTYLTTTLNKREGTGLAFIDRTDIVYGTLPMGTGTGIYKTALDSRHFSCFALNKISSKTTYEGTTVMVNACLNDVRSKQLSDTYLTGSTTTLSVRSISAPAATPTGLAMNWWTARLESSGDVTAFKDYIPEMKKINSRFIAVGTVKKEHAESFKSAIEAKTVGNFKVLLHPDTVEEDYVVYALTEMSNWTIEAASNSTVDLGSGINSYEIIFKW